MTAPEPGAPRKGDPARTKNRQNALPDRFHGVDPSVEEQVELNGHLIAPGGKIDAEAVRRLVESQTEETEEESGADDAALRKVRFVLMRDLQKRLDKYLTDRISFLSRNQLQKLIAGGGVLVNDRIPKSSTTLRRGDVVEVVIPPPPPKNIQPEEIPLEILHEDDALVVINKQPDIIVHPARSNLKGTMVNALAWHLQRSGQGELSSVGKEFARPGVVHRLDRHTTGVIVFAKQDEAHWKLGRQFEHRTVDKRYLAIVHGRIEPEIDVIDLPIGPHPSREKGYREKYVVRHDELGKPAVTIYRVRERYRLEPGAALSSAAPSAPGHRPGDEPRPEWFSLVELELKTGRTHQIRVHLSHSGWPIVGDDMYGGRPVSVRDPGPGEPSTVISRQALHATVLGFRHPISGEPMVFTAPVPGDMARLVALLRAHAEVDRPAPPGATVDLSRAIR